MPTTAKSYDVICLQMRTYLPQLEMPIKKELGKLLSEIEAGLATIKKAKPFVDSMLERVFNFRVKAIKWLAEEGELDLEGVIKKVYPQLEELKLNPKLEILAENILFALRCNKRVVQSLIDSGDLPQGKISFHTADLPTVTYPQFLASLAFSIPDDETVQRLVDWANASLYIELIILSTVIINEKKVKVSEKMINELAFLIANAAQEYSAIAMELGLLEARSGGQSGAAEPADRAFAREQKQLADLGIIDFDKNF